jgi:hypothetical protein
MNRFNSFYNKVKVAAFILIALFSQGLSPAQAKETSEGENREDSPWSTSLGFRIIGLDLSAKKTIYPFLGGTELLSMAGGGIISRAFFRLPDGSRAPEPAAWPGFGASVSADAMRSLDGDLWLRATQYLDASEHFRAFAFGRGQILANLAADPALQPRLLSTSLPEAAGSLESTLGAGAGYTALRNDGTSGQKAGFWADISYEWSHELYLRDASEADVHEVCLEFTGYFPLIENGLLRLALNEHLLGSALLGPAIPEHRLSTIGGNRYKPYPAIGGLVRGTPDYAGDGRLKAANNLELELSFHGLFFRDKPELRGAVTPGILIFFDAGIHDDGAFQADPSGLRLGTGAALSLSLLGNRLYAGAAINALSGAVWPYWGLGSHF